MRGAVFCSLLVLYMVNQHLLWLVRSTLFRRKLVHSIPDQKVWAVVIWNVFDWGRGFMWLGAAHSVTGYGKPALARMDYWLSVG
jgi:hypothetical protein